MPKPIDYCCISGRTPSGPREEYRSVLKLVRTFIINRKPVFIYAKEYKRRDAPRRA